MFTSHKIARILGTDLKVHPSILILLAVLILPAISDGQGEVLKRVIFAGLILTSITLHEFGHILMARRLGHATGDINLNALGGLATINAIGLTPKSELLISAAGPAVNLVLGLVSLGIYILFDPPADTIVQYIILSIIATNAILMAFNLIPIFPLDGGRILRSILAVFFGKRIGTFLALGAGMVLLVPMSVYAVMSYNIILGIICLFAISFSFFEYRRLRQSIVITRDKNLQDQGLGA